MKRIGYDADTGRYHYRSSSGTIWAGAEGAQYGEMTRGIFPYLQRQETWHSDFPQSVSDIPTSISNASSSRSDSDIEAAPTSSRPNGYQLLTSDPVSVDGAFCFVYLC